MKSTKTICLILALLMVFSLFAGCNNTAAETSEAAATKTPVNTAPPTGTPVAEEEPYFPLAETETISYWYVFPQFMAAYMSGPEDGLFFKALEEQTNVQIEFTSVSTETSDTSFNIMSAGGDYTDIIMNGERWFKGGGDGAIEQDAFARLNDLIEDYSPNYVAALNKYDVWKDVTTDNGNLVSFYGIVDGVDGPDKGLAIRQDWLDELGLEMPKTYSQLYDVLKAFQSQLDVESPMPLYYSGIWDNNGLIIGYETLGASFLNQGVYPFYQIDGKVQFGSTSDGFREYLTMLNKFYSEGLISPDFVTTTERSNTSTDLIYTNSVGVMNVDATSFTTHAQNSGIEDFRIVAVPQLVKEENQQLHLYKANYAASEGSVVVSKKAVDNGKAELICRWLDYHYSEEGFILGNYGVEGETFEYVNGQPQFTDLVANNPDGLTMVQALFLYVRPNGPLVLNEQRRMATASDDIKAAAALWKNGDDGAWVYSTFASMTADESAEFSTVYADIHTYISENVVQFIVGTRSLDEWDSYVAAIENMDIDICIALKQAAYDRYVKR